MKRTLIFIGKLIISGILALVVLSAFSLLYYNPATSVAQPQKYTNFRRAPRAFWSYMTEGFGFGVTNNLGYNDGDTVDPAESMIAVIGSSHTEAKEVPQGKNFVSLLQKKLFDDSNDKNNIPCLNLGIGGHYFEISVSNFEYFAESFSNVEYAIIETSNVVFSETQLKDMLEGKYHSDMEERGILYNLVQKIPYVRLLYKQYQDLNQTPSVTTEKAAMDYAAYEAGLDPIMKKISDIAHEKDFRLAIMYHSAIGFNSECGFRQDDLQALEIFRKSCEKYDIAFIDVTDRFVEQYNSNYGLSYGFANTTLGTGHLNELGHSIVAEEIYHYIMAETEGN